MGGRFWTEDEINFVKDNYETKTCRQIGEMLGRSESSVQLLSNRFQIKRKGIRPDFALKDDEPKYGKLKITRKFVENGKTRVECVCDCGNTCVRNYKSLTEGITDDCGCERGLTNTTHGLSHTPLYQIFKCMKNRCYDKNHHSYKDYGERGIIICQEWLDDFKQFYDWAIENGWKDNENLSIDRKEVNGNYEPNNCKWSTAIEQGNNRRNNRLIFAFNEIKTLTNWSRDSRCVVNLVTLSRRLNDGWEAEKAISHPLDKLIKEELFKSDIKNKYGKLTILDKFKVKTLTKARCQCECGNIVIKSYSTLLRNNNIHCGCSGKYSKYPKKLYTIWKNLNKKYKSQVCKDWLENPDSFFEWAINNGYKEGLVLGKNDWDENYSSINSNWISFKERSNNKITNVKLTAFGETKNVSEWLEDKRCVVDELALRYRIKANWNPEEALTTPSQRI